MIPPAKKHTTIRLLAPDAHLAPAAQAKMASELRQKHLCNAIVLAAQAAAGNGPLIDEFAELGRRYGHLLSDPNKSHFQVIEGGKL
jgi:hypothetical protein